MTIICLNTLRQSHSRSLSQWGCHLRCGHCNQTRVQSQICVRCHLRRVLDYWTYQGWCICVQNLHWIWWLTNLWFFWSGSHCCLWLASHMVYDPLWSDIILGMRLMHTCFWLSTNHFRPLASQSILRCSSSRQSQVIQLTPWKSGLKAWISGP